MTDVVSEPPRLEFPCAYPVKVLGENNQRFVQEVLAVFTRFTADDDLQTVVRPSSGGRYVGITVTMTATGLEQLAALHEALKAVNGLRLVL